MAYSKFNIIYRLQKWMDSVAGQTFLNYAYSWGASIVILGTLFKLTHLPGADFFLFLGMGTEVFVFFISAFDRPFDKTADGMDLQHSSSEHKDSILSQMSPVSPQFDALEKQVAGLTERIECLNRMIPLGKTSEDINSTLTALHEVYKQQLKKLSSQLPDIDQAGRRMKVYASYLEELIKVHARMLKAVGCNILPEHEDGLYTNLNH